jgi:hypothetical protein
MNGPNKLEGYITLGWKAHRQRTLVYLLAHAFITKKIKWGEYAPFNMGRGNFSFSLCRLTKEHARQNGKLTKWLGVDLLNFPLFTFLLQKENDS